MKRVSLLASVLIFFAGNTFAQQFPKDLQDMIDEAVRQAVVVPDFTDQNSGWVHEADKDTIGGSSLITKFYANRVHGIFAYVTLVKADDGSETEFVIHWGSKYVGRAGIKVGGKWYLAKGQFHDEPTSIPGNDVKIEEIKNSQGATVGFKASLNTLDGPKEVMVLI